MMTCKMQCGYYIDFVSSCSYIWSYKRIGEQFCGMFRKGKCFQKKLQETKTNSLLSPAILQSSWFSIYSLSTCSVQFSSVTQSCPTLCDPMNHSMPDLPVHHQLLEFTQTHVHRVSDAIQPSHPLLSPSPPAPNSAQHQSLVQWVNSLHEVAKVLEFQL